jgi:hypothetical protein
MKKSAIISLASLLLATSCVDSLQDYNIDPKSASTVPGPTLVSAAELGLARTMAGNSVNSNIFQFFVQYWTETTYIDEVNYNLDTRLIPRNFWRMLYLGRGSATDPTVAPGVLRNLSEAATVIGNTPVSTSLTAGVKANQLACTEVLSVYAWSVLVDTYGNVPYTQALDFTNAQPAYDDAATIYTDLFKRLNAAIATMKANKSEAGLGDADIIYSGNMAQWLRFANSLKLRMAITTADANNANSKTQAEQAAVDGVFTSNSQEAEFKFLTSQPNTNPLWENLSPDATTRHDYVGTSYFVNTLTTLNDPRLPIYFLPAKAGTNAGKYVGGVYGTTNTYTQFSNAGEPLLDPTFPGIFESYAEVEFLLAEAAARSYNVGGTPESHYNAGVTASIVWWGGTNDDATTYLAQPTVAYTTAAGTYKQKIGMQKWIAEYVQPVQAWTDWRRLDYPQLTAPATAQTPIPLRLPYPTEEQNLNSANYTAAASAIGGDKVTTKIFWDKF